MKQFAVAHGWRGTCIYNSRNSYLNAQCGACVQIYRKFATQLAKAPLVLALTEAASAHVHVCAENMASKSRKGRLAPLWRQKIRAEYRILCDGYRCFFKYNGNFAARAPRSPDSCFPARARRFMDAYRQHSASMFLVKRHGEHCTRVCGATGSANCSVLCEHRCDRIMPAKGSSTHCRQDFYHSVSRGALQRGECAGATVFHVKHARQVLCKARSRQGFAYEGSA